MIDNIAIRPARRADVTGINEIFNYYVAHTTCVWTAKPTSEAERQAWYEEHGEDMPILVAEYSGRLVGWGSLSSFRTAYTLAGTLEDSVYVHHDFLRRGIGSRLLTELTDAARRKGLRSILANISADQPQSIRLHEEFGFQRVAHLRQVGRKFNQWLDAVYLQLLLPRAGDAPRRQHCSVRTVSPTMTFRIATLDDCPLLAAMNRQLLEDENHRNRFMTVSQLEERMRGWLSGEYRAMVFEESGDVVAYALYRERLDEVYLRQLFVVRNRRRRGFGRSAVDLLRTSIWPRNKRLTVNVLVQNTGAMAFWRAVGYRDCLLTLEMLPDSTVCAEGTSYRYNADLAAACMQGEAVE